MIRDKKIFNNFNNFNKKLLVLALIFIAILLLQSMIFMSFDDYGYGALKYSIGDKYNILGGTDYSNKDIFLFLKETYFKWAGRILGQFVLIKCLQTGEMFIKFIQSIMIFITLTVGIKVFADNKSYINNVFLVSVIFFAIPVRILTLSLFWYAASTIYFWPFAFFVLGLYLTKLDKQKSYIGMFFIFLLGIASGLSQEQVGLAFCIFMFIIILLNYIETKSLQKSFKGIVFFSGIILGYLILIAAPGNFVRMSDATSNSMINKNILDLINDSFKTLIPNLLLVSRSLIYNCIIIFSVILLLKKNFENSYKFEKIKQILISIMVFTQVLLMVDITQYNNSVIYIVQILNIIVVIAVGFFISLLYKDNNIIALIIACFSSLIPILVSPYFVDRMLLPMFVFFVFILTVLIEKSVESYSSYFIKTMKYIMIIMGIAGYICITYGYFQNSIPRYINNCIIKDYKQELSEGKKINSIYLYKNINETYTGTQPYEVDYIDDIKSYYGINQKTDIIFQDFPIKNPWKALNFILKKGYRELEYIHVIKEINTSNNVEDISNYLFGYYNLEEYPDNNYYWVKKQSKCILKNNRIGKYGLKVVLDVPEENILKSNADMEKLHLDIYINDKLVANTQLSNGKQEIKINGKEIQNNNNIYKVELKSNCDFSPVEAGINLDSRRFFAKIYYIGADDN